MNDRNPYSIESFLGFITNNFSLLVIVGLFFLGGFFFGSVWTENKMIKNGATSGVSGSAAQPTAGAPAPGAPDHSEANLLAQATALGIDADAFQSCMSDGEAADRVTAQMEAGSAAGVSGTPHTVVMLDGEPVDVIEGALPYDSVAQMIEGHLNGTATVNATATQAPVVTAEDYMSGNADARLVLVEYSDFSCGFCQRFHPTMKQIMAEYGDQIAWVYRHYPFLGPSSMTAATAADCVGSLGGDEAFWQYTDTLMTV